MRISHIENRLEQQLTLRNFIVNSVDNLKKNGFSSVTPQRVNARLSALRENWENFSLVHNTIGLALTKLNQEDKAQIQNHIYFSENLFSSTYDAYLEAIDKMNSFLDRDSESNNDIPSTSQNSVMPVYFHARLPRIDIPKFNGTPSDWLSFKDLFSSLILANPTLSSVEKLQYLKTSLVGSASHLLKNTTLTSDNFQKAWEALIAFYKNKRLLVNSALHSLLTLKRMTKESASEMEQLYTNIMQIHRTLETLKRPIQHWDDFFVFIAVQRLDSDSVKVWEQHLGSVKEAPTWNQFSEFLITRLLSLQAFEKSRTGKSGTLSNQNSFKSHFQGKVKEKHSNKSSSCTLCSSNHYITSCPQYNAKSASQRREILKQHNLCYNCLGSHRVANCRITKRCLKCGHKHHTTIYIKEAARSTSSKITPENSHSKSTDQPLLTLMFFKHRVTFNHSIQVFSSQPHKF